MAQWEYRLLPTRQLRFSDEVEQREHKDAMVTELNRMGAQGWEAVTTTYAIEKSGVTPYMSVRCKRQVQA